MNADIQGALNQINNSWRVFTHNGKPMTKEQVKAVLEYGIQKGYDSTDQLSSEEIYEIVQSVKHPLYK